MLRVFFGHHKCASQWVSDVFRDMCIQSGLCFAKCTDPRNLQNRLSALPQNEPCMLFYTNAEHHSLAALPDFLGFHVIRDPRDVCISAYYSHLYSHPTTGWSELEAHRGRLESLNFEDGLLLDMEFCKEYLNHMGHWDYHDPRVLELRFEEITASPLSYFKRIVAHLNMGQIFSSDIISAAVDNHRYLKKSNGREPGKLDIRSHYRSGLSRQWEAEFTPAHMDFFNTHYGWILKKTDYQV